MVVAAAALAAACTSTGSSSSGSAGSGGQAVPKGCTAVDMASSPEKIDLVTDLARRFNGSSASKSGGTCAFVRVHKQSSGTTEALLAQGWPAETTNGAQPGAPS